MSAERNILTEEQFIYVYLFEAAKHALEQAESAAEDRFYNCMFSIVFSAFCIEASLNQIGEKLFPFWSELELLNHKQKLNIIAKQLELSPDFSHSPFQSYSEIFKFRNLVAHAKPGEFSNFERLCDFDHAKKFLLDSKDMVTEIHKRFVEYIEAHQDEYGEDFFEESGIIKEDPFGIMGRTISDE